MKKQFYLGVIITLMTFVYLTDNLVAAPYYYYDLGYGSAKSINDLGQVVGNKPIYNQIGVQTATTAYIWSQSTGSTSLGYLSNSNFNSFEYKQSYATSINNNGQVVGWSNTPIERIYNGVPNGYYDPVGNAFKWSPTTGMQNLGTNAPYSGRYGSSASSINNNGWVVGTAGGPGYAINAYRWSADGTAGYLPGWDAQAFGNNDNGNFVGYNAINTFIYRAAYGTVNMPNNPNTAVNLPLLSNIPGDPLVSSIGNSATAINNNNKIVGGATDRIYINGSYRYDSYACLWSPNIPQQGQWSVMDSWNVTDLGTIGTDLNSLARSINENNLVVGNSNGKAFLWSTAENSNGMMYDLNNLAENKPNDVTLEIAYDINNSNWIVGESWSPTEGRRGFLLTTEQIQVVPIPSAVWLFGSGLVGVIGLRRFRKS